MSKAGKLTVTLVRSPIGTTKDVRDTVRGLGLRKIRQVRELEDTPAVRGMVFKVRHLVDCDPADAKRK